MIALSVAQMFSLKLEEFGPYTLDYTRNGRCALLLACLRAGVDAHLASGRYLLLGGRKGHLALIDWSVLVL